MSEAIGEEHWRTRDGTRARRGGPKGGRDSSPTPRQIGVRGTRRGSQALRAVGRYQDVRRPQRRRLRDAWARHLSPLLLLTRAPGFAGATMPLIAREWTDSIGGSIAGPHP